MSGTHRASRPRSLRRLLRSRAVRAVLCLGCGLGLGGVGTLAYWTDTATVPSATISSGTLDVKVNGADGTTLTGLAMADMVPGESAAATLTVSSAIGTLPLGYHLSGTATGDLAPGLRWSVHLGTAGLGSGTQAQGNRSNTCTGTALASGVTLGATTTNLVGSNTAAGRRNLGADATESLCVRVLLDPNAANALQGRSASATLTVHASQMGAP